jgi:predicted AAA+ superfamily ATPase
MPLVGEWLGGFRALVVNGPRQAGKSTLLRHLQSRRGGTVVNLDDPTLLNSATTDPIGFLSTLPPNVAIDEFQRGGTPLLLALKMRLDASRSPGQYVLAGSTRFLSMRNVDETLTGRIGIAELLPLSAGEIRGHHEDFIERAFAGHLVDHPAEALSRADYAQAIATGGFPEMALGPTTTRFRSAWCESYLRTVTAIANIEQVAEIRRPQLVSGLVDQLAARSSNEIVVADLARELDAGAQLINAYLDVLATLYLVRLLPAWTTSRTNRSKRRPVAHLVDTALAAHLVGETAADLARTESRWFGPLLESYVVGEVAKQAGWQDRPTALSHYRDRDQREVDLVLERGREIVAIEVKATATPVAAHAKHLAFLRDRIGDRFKGGVVLHTGSQRVPLGDRLCAVPVSSLWS